MNKRTCKVKDCGIQIYARGTCHKHYHRFLRSSPERLDPVNPPKIGCSITGCNGAHRAKGYCSEHYDSFRRHGDPLVKKHQKYKSDEESFSARVEWQGDCLVWTGPKSEHGYGRMYVRGKGVSSVHRYAWEKKNGTIPDGLHLDHKCHNPPCCNADNLRLATVKQNLEHRQGAQKNNHSTGVLGVSWDKYRNKWAAYVTDNGTTHKLGRFDSLEESSRVAKEARLKYFTHNDKDRV